MSLVLFSKAPVVRLSPKGGLFPICRLSLYGRKRFKDCCRPVVLKRTLLRAPFRQGAHNIFGPPNQQGGSRARRTVRLRQRPRTAARGTPRPAGRRAESLCA